MVHVLRAQRHCSHGAPPSRDVPSDSTLQPWCPEPCPDSTFPPSPHGHCHPPSWVVTRSQWQRKDWITPSSSVYSGGQHAGTSQSRVGPVPCGLLGWGGVVGVLPWFGITIMHSAGNLAAASCPPLTQVLNMLLL